MPSRVRRALGTASARWRATDRRALLPADSRRRSRRSGTSSLSHGDGRRDQKIAATEKAALRSDAKRRVPGHSSSDRASPASPAMQKASRWTLDLFRKYGLDAHLETHAGGACVVSRKTTGAKSSPPCSTGSRTFRAWKQRPRQASVTGRLVILARDAKPADILATPGATRMPSCSSTGGPVPPNFPRTRPTPTRRRGQAARHDVDDARGSRAPASCKHNCKSSTRSPGWEWLCSCSIATLPTAFSAWGLAAYPPYEPSA